MEKNFRLEESSDTYVGIFKKGMPDYSCIP